MNPMKQLNQKSGICKNKIDKLLNLPISISQWLRNRKIKQPKILRKMSFGLHRKFGLEISKSLKPLMSPKLNVCVAPYPHTENGTHAPCSGIARTP